MAPTSAAHHSNELEQSTKASSNHRVSGGSLTALKKAGQIVLHSTQHNPILLVYHDNNVYAVDNRCPHMGFPLDRGSIEQGILTCHWHHARFCLTSGGTFDPFADDLRTFSVEIEDDHIWIDLNDNVDRRAYWTKRLEDGLKHRLNLVIAKATTALVDLGVATEDIVRIAARYGCLHRRSWSPGLTVLVAMANLASELPRNERILALYQGLVHISRNTAGQAPRFSLGPLNPDVNSQSTSDKHLSWFRHFIEVRDEAGAERTLLTAIAEGVSPHKLIDMLLTAATDHVYLDVGHVVDFINKSCEMLDLIGWHEADLILPPLIPLLCNAQRSEELASWRRPIDVVALMEDMMDRLTADSGADGTHWTGDAKTLSDRLLVDDPKEALEAVLQAWESGASVDELGRALALAAGQRVLHFHVQNEFSDWDAVHHTFTYSNALHQLLRRVPESLGRRGIMHGVIRVYLDRFLNVPKARMRRDLIDRAEKDMVEGGSYTAFLKESLNQAGNVDRSGALTAVALRQASDNDGDTIRDIWTTLVHAVVREDADFHTLQIVEAAWRQFSMAPKQERYIPMVAAARYIAAHAPTHRELLQTARVAMRLQAGEKLHEE